MNPAARLHLVAGFLGSGKTTAIVNACKGFVRQGKRVGVVTNDQGKYLVDTEFIKLEDFPAVEVRGGCFCCNYNDLEEQLSTLVNSARPDVIFAESVGSCADLVATVVKPLLQLQNSPLKPSSYTTFVDARLLRLRLNDIPLPFSDGVVYIFDKQIEETNLLIVNKVDLLTEQQCNELLALAQERYPGKIIHPQVSLQEEGIQAWLERIENGGVSLPDTSLEIDYQIYGEGEARLAWLDEKVVFDVPGVGARELAIAAIGSILHALQGAGAPVGHVKFVFSASGGGDAKVSITTAAQDGWEETIPPLSGERLNLLINARVEMPSDHLQSLVNKAIGETSESMGVAWSVQNVEAFHPGFPKPVFRMQ